MMDSSYVPSILSFQFQIAVSLLKRFIWSQTSSISFISHSVCFYFILVITCYWILYWDCLSQTHFRMFTFFSSNIFSMRADSSKCYEIYKLLNNKKKSMQEYILLIITLFIWLGLFKYYDLNSKHIFGQVIIKLLHYLSYASFASPGL